MATNEILQFGNTGVVGTDVLSQANYSADSQRPTGHQPGVARAQLENKVLKQASTIAAAIGQFIADNQANDIVDTASPADIASWFKVAMAAGLGVTQPQFDNDTSLATTAFVQRALGNLSGFTAVNASTTLATAQFGTHVQIAAATPAAQTITLPDFTGLPSGVGYWITNNSQYAQSIDGNGAQPIFPFGGAPLTLYPSETVFISLQAATQWCVFGTIAALNFVSSLGANGYQKLPNGLIIQWGLLTVPNGGSITAALPAAFPNAGLAVFPTWFRTSATTLARANPFSGYLPNASNVTIFNTDPATASSEQSQYFAIGY